MNILSILTWKNTSDSKVSLEAYKRWILEKNQNSYNRHKAIMLSSMAQNNLYTILYTVFICIQIY